MLVTDRHLTLSRPLTEVVAEAVAGGVDTVQVREKDLPDQALLKVIRAISRAVAGRAQVVVNGRPAVATATGTGLHLPEAAPWPGAAPASQGSHRPCWPLLGRSVHGTAAAQHAVAAGVDYLLAGTIFTTASKPGAALLGTGGLRQVVEAAHGVPVLAIGGITAQGIAAVVAAGGAGVAVQRAILQAPDPARAARTLREAIDLALPT